MASAIETVSWIEGEAPLLRSAAQELGRLGRRARGRWVFILVLAGAATLAAAAQQSRSLPEYRDAVSLLLSRGQQTENRTADLASGLRSYVDDVALSRQRLATLLAGFPEFGPAVASDPVSAIEEFREFLTITITQEDFAADFLGWDPAAPVRITIAYRSANPELAHRVTTGLASLIVQGESSRRSSDRGATHAMARDAMEGARLALERDNREVIELETKLSSTHSPQARLALQRAEQLAKRAKDRVEALTARASRLEVAAQAETLALPYQFRVSDPGRIPPLAPSPGQRFFATLLGGLPFALAGFALLVAAFDPHVAGLEDLRRMGLPTLAHIPAVPAQGRLRPHQGAAEPDGDGDSAAGTKEE